VAFEERYKDIGCQVCKVLYRTISGRGQLRKSPRKSSRWDLFPEPDCVTSIGWAELRITFSLRENNGPRKPEMFSATFDCYHSNQARTRPDPNIICATRPETEPVQTDPLYMLCFTQERSWCKQRGGEFASSHATWLVERNLHVPYVHKVYIKFLQHCVASSSTDTVCFVQDA
jgi:hypothetical protein